MHIKFLLFFLCTASVLFGQDSNTNPELELRYNQVTYIPGQPKYFSIVSKDSFEVQDYTIYDENERVVAEGTTSAPEFWKPSHEYVASIKLDRLDTEGNYKLQLKNKEVSFKIDSSGLQDLAKATLGYYYYNRASTAITEPTAGVFKRPAGIADTLVKVHASAASRERPEGTIIAAPGGWYDAGDYNKYIVNSGISTYTLLAAYAAYPEYYDNISLSIPESNNDIPDILDEITYNLDWMLAMQDPNDGGVYHKLTGLQFSGVVMPAEYDLDRYVVAKSTAAALDFAAVMASASRIFKDYEINAAYSRKMLNAAKKAYQWALDHPEAYFENPPDVATGEYGDKQLEDEFHWAAIELYLSTEDTAYRERINLDRLEANVPTWSAVGMLGILSINLHPSPQAKLNKQAENKLKSIANRLKASITSNPMHVAMGSSENDFNWGSNGNAGNQLFLVLSAYEHTQDSTYLEAAFTGVDYLLGRNGTGYSYVTGYGTRSPEHPHHRISEADTVNNPVPGMVVGGPNPGQQDSCSYPSDYPASSYSDSFCSYASNEVTINWNAPAVYVLNALNFYAGAGMKMKND